MNDFKFIKGFFTGVLVTDAIVATGLLYITWHTLKSIKDHNHTLGRYGRYDSYAEYRKHDPV